MIIIFEQGDHTHLCMLESVPFSVMVSKHVKCTFSLIQGISLSKGGMLTMQIFALNKFTSLNTTLSYNAPPLTTFEFAFHSNPDSRFSHSHNVNSQLECPLVKFLNFETHYSIPTHTTRKTLSPPHSPTSSILVLCVWPHPMIANMSPMRLKKIHISLRKSIL